MIKVIARFSVIVLCITVWLTALPTPSTAQDNAPQVTKLFEEISYYLQDVTFIDANTGWAVGDVHWDQAQHGYTGTIIQTTDAGVRWTAQSAGVNVQLNAVAFIDANNGWAAGTHGTIVHTTDGGQNWTPQTIATTDEFRDITFMDTTHGWAVTTTPTTYDDFFEEYTDWDATLWATNDGGQSWQQQTLPDDASILHGVEFADALTGWAVGAKRAGEDAFGDTAHTGVIYHTADGGQTWTEQFAPANMTVTAVDFVDMLNGWAVGFPTNSGGEQRAVLHTSDGGLTWDYQEPGNIYTPLWDVQFIDAQRGYLVGVDYVGAWGPPVYRTFDGGTTWEEVKMEEANPLSVEGLYGVAVAGDLVVAVGDHDYVAISTQAWDIPASNTTCLYLQCLFEQSYINPHYILHAIYFTDDQQGWAAGSKTFDVSHWGQVILHTQDGGLTWEPQYEQAPDIEGLGAGIFSTHRLDDIWFTDTQTGWASGTSTQFYADGWITEGALLHTTDGGATWQDSAATLYEDREREFFALNFTASQSGWALAAQNFPSSNVSLARTDDGGTTWRWVDTGVEGTLSVGFALVQGDLDFPDVQHGWAAGGLGIIVHTADGGNSWTAQTLTCDWPECPKRLFALDMIDTQTGWIGGEGLYQTTDGGVTWLQQPLEIADDIYALQFLDAQRGWLTGDDGLLMRTADGGATWEAIPSGESTALNGLYFITPEQGWIVGDYGVILSYTG